MDTTTTYRDQNSALGLEPMQEIVVAALKTSCSFKLHALFNCNSSTKQDSSLRNRDVDCFLQRFDVRKLYMHAVFSLAPCVGY